MARTHEKVGNEPAGTRPDYSPSSAAEGVEEALGILKGRWKLVILFHLFDGEPHRFSELERCIPAISQKMLGQQLRLMERDGIIRRTVHPQVPPKVEYMLTPWGLSLCPALDGVLEWLERRCPSAAPMRDPSN
jgi:DNA-binding HxlR family transcriptional regulator